MDQSPADRPGPSPPQGTPKSSAAMMMPGDGMHMPPAPQPVGSDAGPEASARLSPRVRWTIAALIVGAIAPPLDATIVTIATHVLGRELGVGVATIQWVMTAYLLALAVAIPVTGWAQRRWGGRRVWLFGLAVFVVGTVLCALAWDAGSLIAFRALQGFGGGFVTALMQTLAFQAAGRATGGLVAAISIPMATAPILGPVVGGAVLNWLDWRWLFVATVPLLIVSVAMSAKLVHPTDTASTTSAQRLDVLGLLLLAPGLVLCLLALSASASDGSWTRPGVLVPLVAGCILLGGFSWWALRRGQRALVDIALLKVRSLATASAVFVTIGATMYATMFLLPLFWQDLKGYAPLTAGLLLIPQGVGALVVRAFIPRLVDRHSPRLITAIAFGITAAATVPFAFADEGWPDWILCLILFVRGLGMGSLMIPPMAIAYQDVSNAQYPDATMLTRISQQVGASFGVAIVAVALDAHLRSGTADGFHAAFWWATGMTAVAVLLALLLPRRSRRPGGMRM